jgi:hypothetical protein
MKSYRKALLLVVINLVALLFLLESAGLVRYGLKSGQLFYTRETSRTVPDATDATSPQFALHPYVGYTHRPGLPMSRKADDERLARMLAGSKERPAWVNMHANNLGFFCEVDYPYEPEDPGEYLVGVFGGSVAHWFALQGGDILARRMEQQPALQGRSVKILNVGQGGFKQPQQLQTLIYFLGLGQHFDFVINIGGFNEVVLSEKNYAAKIDASMPSAQHMNPILAALGGSALNMEYLNRLQDMVRLENKLNRLRHRKAETKSAGLHFCLDLLEARTARKYRFAVKKYDRLSRTSERTGLVELLPPPALCLEDRHAAYQRTFALWGQASLVMQRILNGMGTPYLEVVQPNQYYTPRKFSAAEAAIALDDDSPYKRGVEEGYPMLEAWLPLIRAEGLNLESAIHLFDEVDDVVFSDNGCHYNQTGNEILADFIADRVEKILAAPPRLFLCGQQLE